MQATRTKRIAVALLATVVLGAGGLAISNAASDEPAAALATPAGAPTGGGPGGGQPPMGGGGPPGLTDLADALGVTEDELASAFQEAMPQPGSGTPGDPGDMAAALAAALDLPEADVAEALEATRPDGAPDAAGAAPPDGDSTPS